jgi:hypothetical protein
MVRAEAPSGACQIRGTAVWQDGPHAASRGHLEPECADPRAAGAGLSWSGARGAPGGSSRTYSGFITKDRRQFAPQSAYKLPLNKSVMNHLRLDYSDLN